jgi:hypothetical protein
MYATGTGLVGFVARRGSLGILERRGLVASTMEEAQEQVLTAIRQHGTDRVSLQTWMANDWSSVPLPLARIPGEFWSPPLDASMATDYVSVVAAVRDGDGWRVTLRGRWDQEIVLDASFHFVSTRTLVAPKQDAR